MYSYYVCHNTTIDFNKFRILRKNYTNPIDIKKDIKKEKENYKKLLDSLNKELKKLHNSKNNSIIHFSDKNNKLIGIGSYCACFNPQNTYYKSLGYITDMIDIGGNFNIMVKKLMVIKLNYQLSK